MAEKLDISEEDKYIGLNEINPLQYEQVLVLLPKLFNQTITPEELQKLEDKLNTLYLKLRRKLPIVRRDPVTLKIIP